MLNMAMIKLTLVFCAMLNLASATERTCEKRAYDLMQNCTGVVDLTNCLRDKLPEMGGCNEAEQLLGLAQKVVPQTCEQKAEGIKGRCEGAADLPGCLRNQLPEMNGCDEAEKLLGLAEKVKPKTCEERAEEIKVKCQNSTEKQQCLEEAKPKMEGCENVDELLGLAEKEKEIEWTTLPCETRAEVVKLDCVSDDNVEDCLRSAIPRMTDCPNAKQLLGIDA